MAPRVSVILNLGEIVGSKGQGKEQSSDVELALSRAQVI